MDAGFFGFPRSCDVERPDSVIRDEFAERRSLLIAILGKVETWLPVFLCEADGLERAARGHRREGEDHSPIRIPDIPLGALEVTGGRCLR